MALGIFVGWMVFTSADKKSATQIAGYISIISDIFLRLIKMLIGPLVFSRWWSASRTWAAQNPSDAFSPERSAGS